jgi:hypothetical protein
VVTAQDAVYRRKDLTIRTSKTVRKGKTPSAGKRPPGLDALQRDGQCIRAASTYGTAANGPGDVTMP